MTRQRATGDNMPRTVILPPRGWVSVGLAELWQHRELLYFLAWRDLKVRYKQTFMGVAWAVLQPLLMMLIFTLFLGRLANVSFAPLPYAVAALAGLLPWNFFVSGTTSASDSVVSGQNLVSRVYFPRLILPAASMLSWFVDLLIGIVLLAGMMVLYHVAPSWTIVLAPLFLVLAYLTALGVGTWLSALNVAYRDVKYAVPFLMQLWLFVTPVVYPASLVPERFQWAYGLNPMAGVVEGFRWAVLGGTQPSLGLLLTSAGVTLVLAVTGVAYFKNMERYFADVI
jgi:lipopolysaccharide transport system permease protein